MLSQLYLHCGAKVKNGGASSSSATSENVVLISIHFLPVRSGINRGKKEYNHLRPVDGFE